MLSISGVMFSMALLYLILFFGKMADFEGLRKCNLFIKQLC